MLENRYTTTVNGVVYRLVCLPNGRYYVGSSTAPDRRLYLHKRDLAAGKHHSPKLQAAWNKYGPDAFTFEIIDRAEGIKALLAAEQRHIDAAGAKALNCARYAGSPLGVLRTPEQRAAMSAAKRKLYQTEAGRAAIEAQRAKVTGRVQSPEERAMRSASLKGKKCGRKWTPEQRAAHSKALTGRKMPPVSDETRAKISSAKRGKTKSAEAVAAARSARLAWVQAEAPEWLRLRLSGLTYREIERRTGRSRDTVARECKARGAK